MLKTKMILSILALTLAALACNLPSQASPTPTESGLQLPTTAPTKEQARPSATVQAKDGPTAAPDTKATATQAPSPEPPTAAATKTDLVEFGYKGVKFTYKKGLFANVNAQIAPLEVNDLNVPGWPGAVPERYVFDFEGYPLQGTFHKPEIILYPVKAYVETNATAGDISKALDDVLRKNQLDSKQLPFLPMWNAAQVFSVYRDILPFQNGRGVRYLTCYAQAIVAVNNSCIFYTYQGLTADGNYYLSAVFPIRLDVLDTPEYKNKFDPATMDDPQYEVYLKEIFAVVEKASPDAFSPSITDLDAVVKSVLATPTVELKGAEVSGVNCPGALTSRLRSGLHIRVTFTDGTPLRLRDGPGKSATVLKTIPEGGKMTIVGGPQCVSAGVWWQVKLDSGGQVGWVLEGENNVYFVEPVP